MNNETFRRVFLRKEAAAALFGMVISLCAVSANAQVYKWVDANGVTQYSDSKSDANKSKPIPIKTDTVTGNNKPRAPSPTSQGAEWVEKDLGFRQRKVMKDQAEREENEKIAQTENTRRSACLEAREQIDTLELSVPVYEVNERGERVFISDGDRARRLQAAKIAVSKYCPR